MAKKKNTNGRRAGVRVSSTRPSAGTTAAGNKLPRRTKSDRQPERFTASVYVLTESEKGRRDTRDSFALGALIGGFNEYLTAGDAWDGYGDFAASCFNMADAMMRERAARDAKKA